MDQVSRSTPRWYWALVLTLIGFGFLAILSIGFPFFVVGLTLAALSPFRHRRGVFWPTLAVVSGFFVGYAVVAPLSCSLSVTASVRTVGSTTTREICRSVLGITSTGSALTPGLLAGLVVALVAGVAATLIVRHSIEHIPPTTLL